MVGKGIDSISSGIPKDTASGESSKWRRGHVRRRNVWTHRAEVRVGVAMVRRAAAAPTAKPVSSAATEASEASKTSTAFSATEAVRTATTSTGHVGMTVVRWERNIRRTKRRGGGGKMDVSAWVGVASVMHASARAMAAAADMVVEDALDDVCACGSFEGGSGLDFDFDRPLCGRVSRLLFFHADPTLCFLTTHVDEATVRLSSDRRRNVLINSHRTFHTTAAQRTEVMDREAYELHRITLAIRTHMDLVRL